MSRRMDYQVGDMDNGALVQLSRSLDSVAVRGGGYPVVSMDWLWQAAFQGKIFVASDADQNDTVTGQTSFADTTPTFLLDVPYGIIAIPLFLGLSQTGTIAGGVIEFYIEIDNVKRYSSGGTAEKSFNTIRDTAKCSLYSTPTALAGYGINVAQATIAQDVSPAEGIIPGPIWRPFYPMHLEGPASLNIYTIAAVTAPTWHWQFGWLEVTRRELEAIFAFPVMGVGPVN